MRMSSMCFVLFFIGVPVAVGDDRVPEGLSGSDWSSIRGAYEANRHAAVAVEGGFQARNPGQQWRTRFDGRGFLTTPDAGEWVWGIELVSVGRAGAERTIKAEAPVSNRCGSRVEYDWNETLTEWYVNDQRGLEHGFTVQERPESSALRAGGREGRFPEAEASGNHRAPSGRKASSESHSPSTTRQGRQTAGGLCEPLQFTLAVRGDLRPQVSGDGRGVTFIGASGAAVVNYGGLKVFDADGADVPAWFELAAEGLRLNVDDRAARYPLTIDPIAQQAYLKASNTAALDVFGSSVSVSGDTVVVGASGEASNATGVNGNQADNSAGGSGAAYVFVRSGDVWSQQAYLKASNTGGGDGFGYSVAASDDTVVVGAHHEASNATGVNGDQADNSAMDSGAAYVFVRSGGVWSQQAYLKASNTGWGDLFGRSVSVSSGTVVVGAFQEASNATGVNGNQANNSVSSAGAAYVFVRSDGVWSQQAYLKASNTGTSFDFFGYSVSVSGDTVVVGAYAEDSNATGVNGNQANNSASASGAAYVFVRSGGVWSQQAYLKASNTGTNDGFGFSVAVSGDAVVVGAWQEASNATGVGGNQADNSAFGSGAAYIFVRSGGVWSQQAYLKASNTDPGDLFGHRVSVSGDTVVVSADEDSNATGVNGNQADNSATNSGAAYVFVRSGGTWSQQAYLKASNTGADDQFGWSVAVSGDTVVVGANLEDSNASGVNGNQADNSAAQSGAVYVFTGVGCPTRGNMNCDCAVDEGDVEPFVQALIDPAGYAAAFLGCSILNGDMQPDGNVDGGDVQGFVGMLVP